MKVIFLTLLFPTMLWARMDLKLMEEKGMALAAKKEPIVLGTGMSAAEREIAKRELDFADNFQGTQKRYNGHRVDETKATDGTIVQSLYFGSHDQGKLTTRIQDKDGRVLIYENRTRGPKDHSEIEDSFYDHIPLEKRKDVSVKNEILERPYAYSAEGNMVHTVHYPQTTSSGGSEVILKSALMKMDVEHSYMVGGTYVKISRYKDMYEAKISPDQKSIEFSALEGGRSSKEIIPKAYDSGNAHIVSIDMSVHGDSLHVMYSNGATEKIQLKINSDTGKVTMGREYKKPTKEDLSYYVRAGFIIRPKVYRVHVSENPGSSIEGIRERMTR